MTKVIYKIKKSKNAKQNSLLKLTNSLGLTSILGTVAVLAFLSFSALSIPVYADGLDYTVQVRPSLNITLSSSTVSLLLNPSTTPFGKADLNVSVGTNNFSGYKLYINATDNKLVNNAYSDPTYINTLSSSTTETTFPANSWGYRISSLSSGNEEDADTSIEDFTGNNFYPFTPSTTTSGTLINSSTTAVNNSTATLTFASKVDYEKPSGLYSLDFNFKALPIVTTYNIQNLDPTLCTSDPTIVTDMRDGQAYTIARLKDGRCWMLDNLRLDLTDPAVQSRLTSQTTNASDEALGYLINGGGSESDQWAESAASQDWSSFTHDAYNEPFLIMSGNDWNRDTIPPVIYGDASGKIGIYYNYCAASAGSYCYAAGITPAGNAEYDVCPASWHLPTGGENGDFQTLCTTYKGSACTSPDDDVAALTMRSALSTPLSGYVNNGVVGAQGTGAIFWSSTLDQSDAYSMYRLGVSTTAVNPQTSANRALYGFSIRCLLFEPQF